MNLQPTDIKLLQKSKILELCYENGDIFRLPCKYLRENSPSAVIASTAKQFPNDFIDINIIAIYPIGQYALKFVFDDGHQSGIYTWELLHNLAVNHE